MLRRIDTKRNSLGTPLCPLTLWPCSPSCCKVDEFLSQRWEKIKHQKRRAQIKINSYVYIYIYMHTYMDMNMWDDEYRIIPLKKRQIWSSNFSLISSVLMRSKVKPKKTRPSPCGTPMIQRHMSICSLFERCHLSWNHRKLSSITIKLSLKYH